MPGADKPNLLAKRLTPRPVGGEDLDRFVNGPAAPPLAETPAQPVKAKPELLARTYRLPPALVRRVDVTAAERGIPREDLVAQVLTEYFERMED